MTEYKSSISAQLVRFANICICVVAILYFVTFLHISYPPGLSWTAKAMNFFTQMIFLIPQVFVLAGFLAVETKAARSDRPHLISLVFIIATVGFGIFWTKFTTAAIIND